MDFLVNFYVVDIHTEWVLFGLGLLTIFSYLFDLFAKKQKYP